MPSSARKQKPVAYMEDFHVGQVFNSVARKVFQKEMIPFAKKYDPQYFHTDPKRAKKSMMGGLTACADFTSGVSRRLFVDMMPDIEMIGRRREYMDLPHAVRPGDTLRLKTEILEVRPRAKNPAQGVLRFKTTTMNQRGETVMETETVAIVPRRPAGP